MPLPYQIDTYVNGKRVRKRFASKSELLQFQASLERQKESAGQPCLNSLDSALMQYVTYCRTNKAESTYKRDIARLATFHQWAKDNGLFEIHDITPAAIEKFKNWYLSNAPLDPKKARNRIHHNPKSSVNKYLQLIKAMFNWAHNQNLIADNPIHKVPILRDVRRKFPRIFSKEELEIIFKTAPSPYNEFFRLLVYTGMRVGEALYLEWSDIDRKSGLIKIQSKPGFHPKTYEIRSVPIHPAIAEIFTDSQIRKSVKYIFDDGHGNHAFTNDRALKYLKNTLRLNSLPDANLYTFRHTFASNLVMAGVDIATIKELMGHASITTTEQYLHVAPERKISAIERLEF